MSQLFQTGLLPPLYPGPSRSVALRHRFHACPGRHDGSCWRLNPRKHCTLQLLPHCPAILCMCRFPALIELYQPIYLLAIARSPIPQDLSLSALLSNPQFVEDTHEQLLTFMSPLENDAVPSNSSQGAESAAEETEQDAMLSGAVSVMAVSHHSWRGVFRKPRKLVGVLCVRLIWNFLGSDAPSVLCQYLIEL